MHRSVWVSVPPLRGPHGGGSVNDMDHAADRLRALVRDVPDFPRPGVLFRDLTGVFADRDAFRAVIRGLAEQVRPAGPVTLVAGVEARGFVVAAALAQELGCGVLAIRKRGKLPPPVVAEPYDLEYGTDVLEAPVGVVPEGSRAVVVDDVLATGGTLAAATAVVERVGVEVAGIAVVLEIEALGGRSRIASHPLVSLLAL